MNVAVPADISSTPLAHRIFDEAEAISAAHKIAAELAPGAIERDRVRQLPYAELDRVSETGLLGITVPRAYGGAGVGATTLAEVTAILSAADASLGQIPQNHFYMIEALRIGGSEAQKRFFFERVLNGRRIGNAFCETGTKNALEFATRIDPQPGGGYVVNGAKFYSTGVLFAHWLAVVAKTPADRVAIAFLPRGTKGVAIIDDWSGFGQKVTGSGTTNFDNAFVAEDHVIDHQAAFDQPSAMGPLAQIIHAGVDLGIARAALRDTIAFVKEKARPWADSGLDRASEDPHLLAEIGLLTTRLHAAEALVERAGRFVDIATAHPSDQTVAEASVAVAQAKIATTEIAIEASSKLFELCGTRSALAEHGLDRHWRNARTHTLHDPVRWKYHAIGNFVLNGVKPPRHGAL